MSLKLRLFLLIGGLVAVLIGAEAWLVKRLASDLTHGVEGVALGVSESLLTTFRTPAPAPGADAPHAQGVIVQSERTIMRHSAPDAPHAATERVVALPAPPVAVIATEPSMSDEQLLALIEAVHGAD